MSSVNYFSVKNVPADIYIGTGAGTVLYDDILNAESDIKVVSPYLTPDYIDILLEKAENGVDITLVTNDMNKRAGDPTGHGTIVKKLLRQENYINKTAKKKRMLLRLFSLVSALLNAVLSINAGCAYFCAKTLDLNLYAGSLGLTAMLFIITLLTLKACKKINIYMYSYSPLIDFKMYRNKRGGAIHSKVYCIDEKTAYIGSLNFTKNGFKNYYETSVRITDAEAVLDISDNILTLYNDEERDFYSYDELGRLYFENSAAQ